MSLNHIIESWRDEEYRDTLNDETRSLLPESPAGEIELDDAELVGVDGGTGISITYSLSYSWTATWDLNTHNNGGCKVEAASSIQ